MKKDYKIYLKDILDSINKIQSYVGDISEEEFLENTEIQDAVIRRFEIIGEASKNIPEEFRNNHPNILWRKMSGMRDVLIHNYQDVDIKIVWDTINTKISEIEEQIEGLL